MPKTINKELLFILLQRAAKSAGRLDPDEALSCVEEEMTLDEYAMAQTFLDWCIDNKRTFGHNIAEVFAEFEKTEFARWSPTLDVKPAKIIQNEIANLVVELMTDIVVTAKRGYRPPALTEAAKQRNSARIFNRYHWGKIEVHINDEDITIGMFYKADCAESFVNREMRVDHDETEKHKTAFRIAQLFLRGQEIHELIEDTTSTFIKSWFPGAKEHWERSKERANE